MDTINLSGAGLSFGVLAAALILVLGLWRRRRDLGIRGMWGTLGTLYRPRFLVGGVAVHGAPNVPSYPASHGCIRVSNPAMDMIWLLDLLPIGAKVVIHD